MREIITLQVGQCGNRVGQKFWEVISDEHGIGADGEFGPEYPPQLKRISVYFRERYDGRYVPRAILTDLETDVLDGIQSEVCGPAFDPGNFVSGITGAANNYSKGHYIEEPLLMDSVIEILRNEYEACDSMQGFQMVHSLGGGSGSGLATLLMIKIKEDYPDSILNNYSVIPSTKVSDVVVEPYNTVLALRHLVEYSDATYCLDNEALFNICFNVLREKSPQFSDLNHLISTAMSGITTCFRFPAELNSDLRKLAVNMVPFPRLHFFIPGFTPVTSRFDSKSKYLTVKELAKAIFDPNNMLVACDPKGGSYLTIAAIFRGMLSVKEVEEEMTDLQERNESHFVQWLPNNMKISICDIPSRGLSESATFVGNSTSIRDVFRRVLTQFQTMYNRKAFIHWYTGQGMEQEEFTAAETAALELIEDYELQDKEEM